MESLTVILFLCATVPMVPALYLIPDKPSRLFLGYMLLGMSVCLIASAVNTMLLNLFGGDMAYVSTNITPIAEELMKALPVLYFAIFFSDKRDTLISISYAIGIGYAVLENMVILTGNVGSVTILWAFVRGFGAARMHSACTSMVGRGIAYINKRRKLFYCGTLSLLISATIIHALFNTLVQSEYRELAFILVLIMYLPQMFNAVKYVRAQRQSQQA